MMKLNRVVAGLVLTLPLAAYAQSKAAPAAPAKAPTLSQVLDASGIALSGAVDVSYDWADVDGPLTGRQFDTNKNTFSLHQVNLLVSKDFGGGVGATVNAIAGDDAAVVSGRADQFDIHQGFVSYTDGALTVIGGRFVTLAGYEVINPAGNVNASRSILFFNQPLVHTGVRGTYKLSDALAVTLGLNNAGFGTGKVDGNTEETIEAQIALTPTSDLSVFLTGYSGNGDAGPNGGAVSSKHRAEYVDLVVNLGLGDMLSIGLNADYSAQEAASGTVGIQGAAAYVNAKLSPKLRTSLRGEYAEFDTGNTAGAKNAYARELTLTTGYAVTGALELIAEVRQDQVSDNTLTVKKVGIPNDDQTSATLKAILKF